MPRNRPQRTTIAPRGDSREEILAAYTRAKRVDPSITQGRFMMESGTGKWKNEQSAARYFRLIRDDERSGKSLYRKAGATRPGGMADLARVSVTATNGQTYSFITENVGARSAFDNASLKAALLRDPTIINTKVSGWQQRYGNPEFPAIDDEDAFDVERVLSVKRTTKITHVNLGFGT